MREIPEAIQKKGRLVDSEGAMAFSGLTEKQWLEMRTMVITSTDVSTLAGMPKYGKTPYTIYHVKRGDLPDPFKPNERVEAGMFMEPSIAKWARFKLKQLDPGDQVKVRLVSDFMVRGAMGSSFDYEIGGGRYDDWIMECKNVDGLIYRTDWLEDDGGYAEPPDHITCQVQHQLEVSRRPGCLLAVCVGGNELKLIPIARDAEFGANLATLCSTFWQDIEAGNEPSPSSTDPVGDVNRTAIKGHVLDATEDEELSKLLADYWAHHQAMKHFEGQKKAIKAKVLHEHAEDYARIDGMDGYYALCYEVADKEEEIITEDLVGTTLPGSGRKGYRNFDVRKRAEKKAK